LLVTLELGVMQFSLDDTLEILRSTPDTLQFMLEDLPQHWLTCNEGPDTFSPLDVLGHLIHGEDDDWLVRTKMILEHGESVAFRPFDRFAFRRMHGHKAIDVLLEEFEAKRIRNLEELIQLDLGEEQLQLTGTHPELGRVTLSQLLATWAVHDLVHINQISRVMVKQYAAAIGPWKAYVSLLSD
jgi:hypothetical protein